MTAETFIQFLVDRKLRSFFSYSFLISNAFLEEGGAFIFAKSGRKWGYSSAGRAPALQAGGHRFEPDYLHQDGLIAQLVRAHA